jgi:serine/threonine protein kinase
MGCSQSRSDANVVPVKPAAAEAEPGFRPLLPLIARTRRFEDHFEPLPATAPLGSGAFGTVLLARQLQEGGGGGEVAVKVTRKVRENGKGDSRSVIEAELRVLHLGCGHPNIVQQLDVFETPAEVSIVLELMHGGELFDALARSGPYIEADAIAPIRGMCGALAFLHARGLAHRDLKPQNLLLSHRLGPSATLKLCDFGLAKQCAEPLPDDGQPAAAAATATPPPPRASLCLSPESQRRLCAVAPMRKPCGTWPYMAPEVLRILHGAPGEYGQLVDMFAAGIIMFVALSGYHPFDPDGVNSPRRMQALMLRGAWSFDDWRHDNGGGGGAWSLVSGEAKELIARMLETDPRRRITAQQALDHPWTRGDGAKDGQAPSGRLSATIDRDIGSFKARMRRKLKAAAVATTAAMTFRRRGSESAAGKIRQLSLNRGLTGADSHLSLAAALVAEEEEEEEEGEEGDRPAGPGDVTGAAAGAVSAVAKAEAAKAATAIVAAASQTTEPQPGVEPPLRKRPSLLRANSSLATNRAESMPTTRALSARGSLPALGSISHTDPGPDSGGNVGLLLRRRAYFDKFSRKRTSSSNGSDTDSGGGNASSGGGGHQ